MKPEEQKILNDGLSKLFNKIEPEILASLYNDAGELIDFSSILDIDVKRIQKIKSDTDSQYRRGIKEGASKIETGVKEKYDFDSDLVGVDLIDALIVKKIEEAKSTKDITKHAEYIKLQNDIERQLKERDKEWQKKLDAKDVEFAKAKLFEKVSEKALLNLAGRNPILSNDPRKAQAWKEVYLNDLKSHNYQEGTDGSIIVLDKEGGILKNVHGHSVTFDEFEKEISDKYFDYPKSTDRSSPGNREESGKPSGNLPKSEDERLLMLRDPKITPQRRKELTEYEIK